ncbi:hypothetical protein V8D89_015949 [Ganoderma adspersum]
MASSPPKRVCIVGAGASGMAAAYALSKHPDKFAVTVFDKEPVPGGMATSIDIDPSKHGATYINDGVQGCSPAFANSLRIFRTLGFEATEVGMQISFGKGHNFWSNVFPSKLVAEYQEDIVKFGRALSVIKTLEPAFAIIPVHAMLRIFNFSSGFGERMVYPLVALFFGTGNQTPYISSAILERVFLDPSMKLFEFDEKSLLASIPTMLAFPKLHDVYQAWKEDIESRGNVQFKLHHQVLRVVSRNAKGGGPVQVEFQASLNHTRNAPQLATFDELILAIDANSALDLLGKEATWKERMVLGSVKYLYDVTITHNDVDYMNKYYETQYNVEFNAPLTAAGSAQQRKNMEKAFEFASSNFRPLYYTMQYAEDHSKIEMSFDLTHYQPQFRGEKPAGPVSTGGRSEHRNECDPLPSHAQEAREDSIGEAGAMARSGQNAAGVLEPPLEKHVFQTIFRDRDEWWKQQSHRWQHYAAVVPWMMFINGEHNTHYAGAWSVLNMHELAVTSGFAAAYRLGANYPFHGDEACERLFRLYLGLSHGSRMRKEDRKGLFA